MAAAEALTTPVVEKDDDPELVHEAAVDIARAYEVVPPPPSGLDPHHQS